MIKIFEGIRRHLRYDKKIRLIIVHLAIVVF